MERIFIQHKGNIMDMLQDIRRDLNKAKTKHYDLTPVKDSPTNGIFYSHEKRDWLKEIGALNKPHQFGYFRSNERNYEVTRDLNAADKLLVEIIHYLRDCHVRPKAYRFTELELSRFEVIEGGKREPWFVTLLKEGVR